MLLSFPFNGEDAWLEFPDNVCDDPGGVDIARTDDCEEFLNLEDESDEALVEASLENELLKSTRLSMISRYFTENMHFIFKS